MFNWLKDSSKRKVVGVVVGGFCIGLGWGLIASS